MNENLYTEHKILPDFKVVLINETIYWNLEEVPEVDEVWGTYLVDFNCYTYCCEMTPSYWCEWLCSTYNAESFDNQEEQDDAWWRRREEIQDFIQEGDMTANTRGSYFHVRGFKGNNSKVKIAADFEVSDDTLEEYKAGEIDYQELLEQAREQVFESGEAYV